MNEQNQTTPTKKASSKRWPLILLVLLFFGPMLLAWWMYKEHDSFSHDRTNRGYLLQPSLDIHNLKLYSTEGSRLKLPMPETWLFFYVSPGTCEKFCQKNLYNMRQIKMALGKNESRVDRMLVTYKKAQTPALAKLLSGPFRGTELALVSQAQLAQFLAKTSSKKVALSQGYLYLMDPHGNVILSYGADEKGTDALKDIEKLLRISNIG